MHMKRPAGHEGAWLKAFRGRGAALVCRRIAGMIIQRAPKPVIVVGRKLQARVIREMYVRR